jgi:hypothetical protein
VTIRSLALMLLASAVSVSCGSSGGDGAPADMFVGRWMVTAGTQKVNCGPSVPVPDSDLKGTFQQLNKDASNTLSIDLTMGCIVKLDAAGSIATVRPNQTCTITVMIGTTSAQVMGTITSGSFAVSGDTATFSYMGSAMGGGGLFNCTFMASGTSSKTAAAPDGGSSGG